MKKFIIDTSAFLRDPQLIANLAEGDIVIPAIILDELAKESEKSSSYGANARRVGNQLFEIRNRMENRVGGLGKRIMFDNRVPNFSLLPEGYDKRIKDNIILSIAKEIGLENPKDEIELVSGDKYFVLKAEGVLGIKTRYVGDESFQSKSKKKTQKFNNRPSGKVR